MEPLIRRGTQADAPVLKDLDTIVPIDPARAESIDRWLRDDPVLVAEVEGRVVGTACLTMGSLGRATLPCS